MKKIVPDITLTLISGFLFLLFFTSVYDVNEQAEQNRLIIILFLTAFAFIRYLAILPVKYIRKNRYRISLIRILSETALNYITSVLLVFLLLISINTFTSIEQFAFQYTEEPDQMILRFLFLWFFMVLTYTIINYWLYSFKEFQKIRIESERLMQEKTNLQFQSLKSQLSPHYLFNSLNTISSLIQESPAKAEKFIREFAATYQFLLKTRDEYLIEIKEELDFVKSYLYLQSIRYEEALNLDINLSKEHQKSYIPPLALQMLVENIFKHNTVSSDFPIKVSIYSEENQLVVSNSLKPKRSVAKSFGIGLSNIQNRYAFFSKQKPEIKKGNLFIVKLPVINKNEPINGNI